MRTGSRESAGRRGAEAPDRRVLVARVEAVEVLLARPQDAVLGAVVDREAALGVGDDVLAVDDRAEVLVAADLDLQAARALDPVELRPQRDAVRSPAGPRRRPA